MEELLEFYRTKVRLYRTKELLGVEGLVNAATEIIQQFNENPRMHKGTSKPLEYPNVRTVRYYITEGLLPPAAEKRHQSSLFRYPHLIALLLIKWFQAQGLPISVIQDAIRNMTVEQMEKAFGERVQVFTDPARMTSFIEEHEREEGEDLVVLSNPVARAEYLTAEQENEDREMNPAQRYLNNFSFGTDRFARPAFRRRDQPRHNIYPQSHRASLAWMTEEPANPETGDTWRRIKVAEGLELHIERTFKAPETGVERRTLIERLERLLFGKE